MSTLRKRIAAPIALVIALAIAPALSGCSISDIIQGATGGAVDVGGTSVPDGFPAEVPLVDGTVQFGGSVGDDTGRVFNVTIKVTGGNPYDGIKAALEGAGFTDNGTIGGSSAEGGTLIYTNDNWGVLVVVGKDGNDFVVNYTVTSTNQ